MSTDQSAVTLCVWGVKAGMVNSFFHLWINVGNPPSGDPKLGCLFGNPLSGGHKLLQTHDCPGGSRVSRVRVGIRINRLALGLV